jgi:hypothetical protein
MAIEVTYSLDSETSSPYLTVRDGSDIFVHTALPFPYDDVPTNELTILIAELRVIYADALTAATNAVDADIFDTSQRVGQIGDKLNRLILVLNSR